MAYDTLFDADENQSLIAICTRRLIRSIGIGGVVWGLWNMGMGALAIQYSLLNSVILVLGILMFATGVQALWRPTVHILLAKTMITFLILGWNLFLTLQSIALSGEGITMPIGLFFSAAIAFTFARLYIRLVPFHDRIAAIPAPVLQEAKKACKALYKTNPKKDLTVAQTTDRRCRLQMVGDSGLFVQKDLLRAFFCSRDDMRQALVRPGARRLRLRFDHPQGRLRYKFDRKNSERIQSWLMSEEDGAEEMEAV